MVLVSSSVLFTACAIATPITTATQWLDALKANQPDQAAAFITSDSNPTEAVQAYLATHGNIQHVEIHNALPLPASRLQTLEAAEGFEVFYTQQAEKTGSQSLRLEVMKVEGQWKVVDSFSPNHPL